MNEITITSQAARRFLLDRLQLHSKGSDFGSLRVVDRIRRLEAIQIDPVARVGRNQDLALLARDPRYRPVQLERLLASAAVFEYRANEACILPVQDYPVFKGRRRRFEQRLKSELDRFSDTARMIMSQIEAKGPMPSRNFDSGSRVMGYWDTTVASTKETSHVINLLVDSGRLMVVKREGVVRYFDLPAHVLSPAILDETNSMTEVEADEKLFDKYFRAYRLVRGSNGRLGWGGGPMAIAHQRLNARIEDGRVVPVRIEGVPARYFVLAEDLEASLSDESLRRASWRPIRFLPPLDNLLWDRDRLVDLFRFYYRWEVYVPASRRTFGIYAMPVLAGDRLIGRIDPEFRRQHRVMVIHKAQWETGTRVTPSLERAVTEALEIWAKRLGAEHLLWGEHWM